MTNLLQSQIHYNKFTQTKSKPLLQKPKTLFSLQLSTKINQKTTERFIHLKNQFLRSNNQLPKFNIGKTQLSTESKIKRIKSSNFSVRSVKKLKKVAQQKQDNRPIVEFNELKWIPIIDAYDPQRLKNITVNKLSFQKFFQKHNPNQDPLGKFYLPSVINHFKQWKQKISRKYIKILDNFISGHSMQNLKKIGAELKQIHQITIQMKEILMNVMDKYENRKIKDLIGSYKQALENTTQIYKVICIIYQSKVKIQDILLKFQDNYQVKAKLQDLRQSKIKQTQEVFITAKIKSMQTKIISRVTETLNQMTTSIISTLKKMEDMRIILERTEKILTNQKDTIGFDAISTINQIFSTILYQISVFKNFSLSLEQNIFFNDEFKKKAYQYRDKLQKQKEIILQFILNVIKSISKSMIQTLQKYHSLNQITQKKDQSLSLIVKQLECISQTFEKQRINQGMKINQILKILKDKLVKLDSQIKVLTNIYENKVEYVDQVQYSSYIQTLGNVGIQYKKNIEETIQKFLELNKIVTNNNQKLIKNSNKHKKNIEIQFLSNLKKVSLALTSTNFQSQQIFIQIKLEFFNKELNPKISDQIKNFKTLLSNFIQHYHQLKQLRKNNGLKALLGNIQLQSQLIQHIEQIQQLRNNLQQLQQKNILTKYEQCRSIYDKVQSIINNKKLKILFQKFLYIKLKKNSQAQSINKSLQKVQESLATNSDYTFQLKFCSQKKNFLTLIYNKLKDHQDLSLASQIQKVINQYQFIEDIHKYKTDLFDSRKNYTHPNTNMILQIVHLIFYNFVIKNNEAKFTEKILKKNREILSCHLKILNQLKQDRVYKQIKLLALKNQQLTKLVNYFVKQLNNLITHIQKHHNSSDPTTIQNYIKFLDSALSYLDYIGQNYFCLLSSNNEPIYLNSYQKKQDQKIINSFFTGLNLKIKDQFIVNQKSAWTTYNYNPRNEKKQGQKKEQISKEYEKQEFAKINKLKLKTDQNDQNFDKVIQESRQQNKVKIQGSKKDKKEGQKIQSKELHQQYEGDFMQQQNMDEYQQYQAEEKEKISFNQAEKQNKVQKKQIKKLQQSIKVIRQLPSKKEFLRVSQIESIQILIKNIQNINLLFQQSTLKLQVYTQLLNHCSLDVNFGNIPESNIKQRIKLWIDQFIKIKENIQVQINTNLFKKYIVLDQRYQKIMNCLKQLGNMNEISKILKVTYQIAELYSIKIFKIISQQNQIIYISINQQIVKQFLNKILKLIKLTFNQQDMHNLQTNSFKCIEGGRVFQFCQLQQFNIQSNNTILINIEETLKLLQLDKFYQNINYSQLFHKLLVLFVLSNQHTINYVQQQKKNIIQKFQKFYIKFSPKYLTQYKKLIIKYNKLLNQKIQTILIPIHNYYNQLNFEILKTIKLSDLNKIAESIIKNPINNKIKFVVFREISSNQIFYVNHEDSPQKCIEEILNIFGLNLIQNQFVPYFKQKEQNNFEINWLQSIENVIKNIEQVKDIKLRKRLLALITEKYINQSQELNQKLIQQQNINLWILNSLKACDIYKILPTQQTKILQKINQLISQKNKFLDFVKKIDSSEISSKQLYDSIIVQLSSVKQELKFKYCVFYTANKNIIVMFPYQKNQKSEQMFLKYIKQIYQIQINKTDLINYKKQFEFYQQFTLPQFNIQFIYNANIPIITKYVKNQIKLKIENSHGVLYEGGLKQKIILQYDCIDMLQLDVYLYLDDKKILRQSFQQVKLNQIICSQVIQQYLNKIVENEKQKQQEQKRIRQQKNKKINDKVINKVNQSGNQIITKNNKIIKLNNPKIEQKSEDQSQNLQKKQINNQVSINAQSNQINSQNDQIINK